ncbi:MAG: histidine phosphatase family protein [Patescibacteria group bacterium]|nr:histidine phosphatase family protein [Patescibacteria group bacterium]
MAKSSASRIVTANNITGGVRERFRGSSDIPLTATGVAKARRLGQEIAKKGGLDRIYSSKLKRTSKTAEIIANATGAKVILTDELRDWSMGKLEGLAVTPENIEIQNKYLLSIPDSKIPGRGPYSTRDGESFNEFRKRGLRFLMHTIIPNAEKEPNVRTAYIGNFRYIKLIQSWIKAGCKSDGSIDSDDMIRYLKNNDLPPGSVERLEVEDGKVELDSVDLFDGEKLDGNAFIIRHSTTAWNKPENDDEDEDE